MLHLTPHHALPLVLYFSPCFTVRCVDLDSHKRTLGIIYPSICLSYLVLADDGCTSSSNVRLTQITLIPLIIRFTPSLRLDRFNVLF